MIYAAEPPILWEKAKDIALDGFSRSLVESDFSKRTAVLLEGRRSRRKVQIFVEKSANGFVLFNVKGEDDPVEDALAKAIGKALGARVIHWYKTKLSYPEWI